MGNFSEGFWNIFIVVCTLGGILWLYLLTSQNMGRRRPAGSGEVETTKHVWDEDLTELNNPLPRWWVILFYITLAFGVLYLMIYPGLGSNAMFLGWTQLEEYEEEMARAEERYGPIYEQYASLPIEQVAADPKALRIGERLFASYCTVCHGSDAGGVRGFPNLRDDAWQWGGEPGQIETSILAGRTGIMPGWRDALGGDVGVDEAIAHVFSLSGRDTDPAQAAAGEEAIYGVNTGFGKLASVKIPPKDTAQLQRNLILSHCCGVGDALEPETTRLMMALVLRARGRGASGVRPETCDQIEAMLAADVLPVVPVQGSVGASGDLAPLAHMAAAVPGCFMLMGNGTEGGHARPLHSADYDFNNAALVPGSSYWVALVVRLIARAE